MTVTRDTATGLPAPGQTQQDWETSLRAHGRRVTKQRLAVLAASHTAPHQDAEHIWREARSGLPELTLQSVYTVLADLTGLGLLRKIEPTSGPARYETRVGDNHHHAVCTVCGRIEDVDCAVGHAPCLQPADSTMAIYRAEVTFLGLCADCAASEAAAKSSHSTARITTEGES
ncbi:MAG: transcriptional repressor [Renibacterium salmoninarum]|nr:transcriptional repressor [Renibacterium salmoninarum]